MTSRFTLLIGIAALTMPVLSQAQFGYPVEIDPITSDFTTFDIQLMNTGPDSVNIVSDIAGDIFQTPVVMDSLSDYLNTHQQLTLDPGATWNATLQWQSPPIAPQLFLIGEKGNIVGLWDPALGLPEPGSLPLLGGCLLGGGALALRRFRKSKRN